MHTSTQPTLAVSIRLALPDDIPAIIEIDKASYSPILTTEELERILLNSDYIKWTALCRPRIPEIGLRTIAGRLRAQRLRMPYLEIIPDERDVAEARQKFEGRLAAFILSRWERKAWKIYRLAVAPPCRRQGIAKKLFDQTIRTIKSRQGQKGNLKATVGERNLGGQLFLHAQGFKLNHVAQKVHTDPPEDLYAFNLPLS